MAEQQCYHWCPVKRHDWSHPIKDLGVKLDEWERVCTECALQISLGNLRDPTATRSQGRSGQQSDSWPDGPEWDERRKDVLEATQSEFAEVLSQRRYENKYGLAEEEEYVGDLRSALSMAFAQSEDRLFDTL